MHTTADYLQLTDGLETFVVEHVLPAGGSSNIMGLPFMGKSFAIMQLAEAIANPARADWLGFPVHDHGPVAYFQLDTPRRLWANRIRGLQEHAGYDFRGVWWADRLDGPPAFNIISEPHFEWMRQQVQDMPEAPKAVMIDVIREAHRGPEDSSDHMQRVLDGLIRAVEPAGIVIISHTRKPTWSVPREVQDESMDENRGSNALNGRMDTALKLTRQFLFMESRTSGRLRRPVYQDEHGCWHVRVDGQVSGQEGVPPPSIRVEARALAEAQGITEAAAIGRVRRKRKR